MIVPQDVVRVRVHPSVTVIPDDSFSRRGKLEEVEFCEGLLEIGKGAFHACTSLKGIKIPSTVTVICGRAFVYCSGLEEVELSEGLQEIREAAFFSCYRLKNIAIPTTVQQIGEAAFEEVPLQSIKLPDGLENIGPSAFYYCSFTSCRIPPLITTIPEAMFGGIRCMFSLELSENITKIDQNTFGCNNSLRNLAIPPDSEIDEGAFGVEPSLLIAWISSNYSVPLQILSTH